MAEMKNNEKEKVGVVLINFNNANDTIECIYSLLNNNYRNFFITVIDNSESDDSFQQLIQWAEGKYNPVIVTNELLKNLTTESRKFDFRQISFKNESADKFLVDGKSFSEKIIFVRNKFNAGFAAANNLGMKIGAFNNPDFFWLLNNDTVVNSNCISELIHHWNTLKANGKNPGLIGSKILYYDAPDIIQALGDRFNPYSTWHYHIGLKHKDDGTLENEYLKIDYPYGASLFLSKKFIAETGMMCEDYFLYFEELDWTIRGRKKGFEAGVCFSSKVYHKQGIATGKKIRKEKPLFIAFLMYRNLLKFYWKFYPLLFPMAWMRLFLKAIKNLLQQNFKEALLIMRILFGLINFNSIKMKNQK